MALDVGGFLSPFMERLVALMEDEASLLQLHDRAVGRWLDELREVMYDADDLVDDCSRRAALDDDHTAAPAGCCRPSLPVTSLRDLGFRRDVGKRIRRINSRLEEISKDRSEVQLASAAQSDAVNAYRGNRISRETSPVIVDSDVVGIDRDTNNLVGLLTEGNKGKILILAIIGMGGIGKTTLAQKVFNDDRIGDQFEIKIWVCVSQDFNENCLLKQIIRSAGGSCGEAQTRAELDPMVRGVVHNKKFLLVLDDIWNARVWDDLLRNPLQGGAAGSRIMVTTRNEQVARRMGAAHLHQMHLLSVENGWLMLSKVVFGDEGQVEIERLSGVGIRIVRRCDGLPLAIKTVRGVLRTKERSVMEWEKVLANQIWTLTGLPEGTTPALYLSYDDLPAPLKQCFVFCSLFPEDFELFQWDLIQMWIAEGFVKSKGELELEDLAEEYFYELIRRSLLQVVPEFYGAKVCKMHDLLRSLAILLAKGEQIAGNIKVSRPPR